MNTNTINKMLTSGALPRKSSRIPKKEFNKKIIAKNYARKVSECKIIGIEINKSYKKLLNPERSKQVKVRRDTWRRAEISCEEDERLEDMHYANFLGDKYRNNGSSYNNSLSINVKFCDSMCDPSEK